MAYIFNAVHGGVCYSDPCEYNCFCGRVVFAQAGDNNGMSYNEPFWTGANTNADAYFTWSAYDIVDRFVLYFNGTIVHDTGFVSGSGGIHKAIPAGTTDWTIVVYGGGPGTVWHVQVDFSCT